MTHLLELLDSTLVDTAALVDQVYDIVSDAVMIRSRIGSFLRPVVVDLPESTWPITTTLIWILSLLLTISFLLLRSSVQFAIVATYPMLTELLSE